MHGVYLSIMVCRTIGLSVHTGITCSHDPLEPVGLAVNHAEREEVVNVLDINWSCFSLLFSAREHLGAG